MATFDAATIAAGIPSLTLMERAGEAVVREIKARYLKNESRGRVVVLCGPGNNGGDGFVIARLLKDAMIGCEVIVSKADRYTPDCKKNWDRFTGQVTVYESGGHEDLVTSLKRANVIVDALLGTGQNAAPRGAVRDLVQLVQLVTHMEQIPVISVDVPTGVDASSGEVFETHITADSTVTFQFIKRGLVQYPAQDKCGQLVVADIGIKADRQTEFSFFSHQSFPLKLRHSHAHKGSFGTVLVIGGSRNMPGAPVLTGESAYRAGAGLVIKAQIKGEQVLGLPEAILSTVPGKDGSFSEKSVAGLKETLQRANVVALGPGLGYGAAQFKFVKKIIEICQKKDIPLVLDADGLNCIAGKKILLPERSVLTPHPGEAARLLGAKKDIVKKDRYAAVREISKKYRAVTVLKGHHSLIYFNGYGWVNNSGNPYMATAGSGDVLSGVIAAFIAQGLDPFPAASWGVHIHGHAGDIAHQESGGPILAGEIARFVPKAIGTV